MVDPQEARFASWTTYEAMHDQTGRTVEEIKTWAHKHGKGLGSALEAYAGELVGKARKEDVLHFHIW